MKKITCIFIVLLLVRSNVFSQSNWLFSEPVPTSNNLNSLYFLDDNTGWFAGDFGTILKTTNGGATNFSQQYITSDNLNSIFFIDSNTGWTAGAAGRIFKTANGGTIWVAQSSSTSNVLNSISFANADTGWAVGFNNTILKSPDGGSTWTLQSTGLNETWNSVSCTSTMDCYAVGSNGKIIFTTDGGASWQQQNAGTTYSLNSIHFTDQNNGWVAGDGGVILKTTNAGLSWQTLPQFTTMALTSVFFKDNNIGSAVSNVNVFYTVNGGQNWSSSGVPVFSSYKSVYLTNNIGWTAGFNGQISKTTNNGANWTELSTPQTLYCNFTISSIVFSTANNGLMAKVRGGRLGCDQSEVYRTTNGGASWNLIRTFNGFGQLITCVAGSGIVDIETGYNGFFASQGVVLNPGTSNSLYGLISSYACGAQGTLIRYTGSGASTTFTPVTSGTSNDLYSIVSTTSGYFCVGANGTIIKSTDFGINWYPVTSGTTQNLYGLRTVAGKGFCAGNNGTILKTTDGGQTWFLLNAGITTNLRAVGFPSSGNSSVAYVTGDSGLILKTTNEGATWFRETNNTGELLTIAFPNSSTGYIGGRVNYNALLLHNNNLNSNSKNLNLKILIEGFYDQVTNTMVSDTNKVYLRNSSPPYTIADSAMGVISNSGDETVTFQNAGNVSYYIQTKHRNSLETWSSLPLNFNAVSVAYDFTLNSAQTFGNNVKLKGSKWTIYSADVNNDGQVDLTDIIGIYNDALVNLTGYVITDVNGDNIVDLTDLVICFNNTATFVGVVRP